MNNSITNQEPEEKKSTGSGRGVLWGVIAALAVGNMFAIWHSSQLKSQLDEMNGTIQSRISTLSEQTSAYGDSAGRAAAMLKDDVEEAKQAAEAAAAQAKQQAEKRAEQLVNKLANEYKMQSSAMTDDLGQVRSSATQANEGVVEVKTGLNGVRGDLANTQANLDEARRKLTDDLTSVQGDLGVQSGLIATNAEQLEMLRQLGERQYYEFDLPRDKEAHKIGSIAVVVKNTKPKRGKFTLDVIADDQRVEKRDRTINEPVQFYVSGSMQPFEIVVNEVDNDSIKGYLAVPKVLRAAR